MNKKIINNNSKSYEQYLIPAKAIFEKLDLENSSTDVFMYSTSLSDLVDSMNKEMHNDEVGIQVTPNFISQEIYNNRISGFDFEKGFDFYDVNLVSVDSSINPFNAVFPQKDKKYILRITNVDSHNELIKKLM